MTTAIATLRRFKERSNLKKHGKKAFWAWIVYQTMKGTLTTSLIWVPLFFTLWQS